MFFKILKQFFKQKVEEVADIPKLALVVTGLSVASLAGILLAICVLGLPYLAFPSFYNDTLHIRTFAEMPYYQRMFNSLLGAGLVNIMGVGSPTGFIVFVVRPFFLWLRDNWRLARRRVEQGREW